MTATSQDQGKVAGSEPDKTTKPEAEPKSVPLGEFIELRQKHRELLDEVAALKANLAKPKEPQAPAAPAAPAGDPQAALLQELHDEHRVRRLVTDLGLDSEAQGKAVLQVLQKTPGIAPEEALLLATKREPKAFEGREQGAPGRAGHASLTPRPGSQPSQNEKGDFEKRVAYTKSMQAKDKRLAKQYADNHVGSFLAKAMGWEHKKLEIPPQ